MDVWMDVCMGGEVYVCGGWVNRCRSGCMDGWAHKQVDKCKSGCMDAWVDACLGGKVCMW